MRRVCFRIFQASLRKCRAGEARDARFLVDSSRLILGAAGLAAGLGRMRVAGAASQVAIGVVESPCVGPAYVAVSQGFLRDEGLDARIVDITTPGNLGLGVDGGNALAAGRADAVMDAIWTAVPPRMPTGLSWETSLSRRRSSAAALHWLSHQNPRLSP